MSSGRRRIFLCHAGKHKALVRQLRGRFPARLSSWLDEDEILIGDDIESALQSAISGETEYLLIFLDAAACASGWVKRELEWALEKERKVGRHFVLPVFLDEETWKLDPFQLKRRSTLRLLDHTTRNVEALGDAIVDDLHGLIMRDATHVAPAGRPPLSTVLAEADMRVQDVAHHVRCAVYPYRGDERIALDELYRTLGATNEEVALLTPSGFRDLIAVLFHRGLLAGLICKGDDLYVEEEHYSWKTGLYPDEKGRIARRAMDLIGAGTTIVLDSGTTTQAIAAELGQRLKMNHWSRIKVITNSPVAAMELMKIAHQRDWVDETPVLQIYMVGGRLRPNTVALVDDPQMRGVDACDGLRHLAKGLGQADVAFVGTNGIAKDVGFTTHARSEADTKQTMLEIAKRKVIVSDSSKVGLQVDHVFAPFAEDIDLILGVCDKPDMERHRDWLDKSRTRLTYA